MQKVKEFTIPEIYSTKDYSIFKHLTGNIDKNDGITFAGVVRHFRQYNGGGFIDPSFKILTTDWGTRTVLAYLDD